MAENTSISVNKQTVSQYLSSGSEERFIIPEYQRPYAWGDDEITVLFDDLLQFAREFASDEVSDGSKQMYFLGSVVTYLNSKGEREVIDGQQRLTSLMLLLRAIYQKLSEESDSKPRNNLMRKIEPCLWEQDEITGEVHFSRTLIQSRAMSDEFNQAFQLILECGDTDPNWSDQYSKNYRLFQKLYRDLCEKEEILTYNFIVVILNRAILLPIQADTQDTALTIFSTLNNRGLPLSDADIFKAKMYEAQETPETKNAFVDEWQEIEVDAGAAGVDMQSLFNDYMFCLRAKENDTNTTTPGMHNYFKGKKGDYARLKSAGVLDDLATILELWSAVKNRHVKGGHGPLESVEVRQAFDMFSSYTNAWWKYPVATFYLNHKDEVGFQESFVKFLRKLFVELLRNYVETKNVNSIKGAVLRLDSRLVKSMHPSFDFSRVDCRSEAWKQGIVKPSRSEVTRMILSMLSYDDIDQLDVLPQGWEIEHIFPKKWQKAYPGISGYTEDRIKETVNQIGNYIPLPKKQNIQASNGYYGKKRKIYAKVGSDYALAMASELAEREDWSLDDIIVRDDKIYERLIEVFDKWEREYDEIS